MAGSSRDHTTTPFGHGLRGRRRRHLVTAAAGFAVAGALIIGTNTSSAVPSATLYDSWQSSSWNLAPLQQPQEPRQRDVAVEQRPEQVAVRADTGTDRDRPGRSEPNRDVAEDEAVVVSGEEPTSVSIPSMGVQASVIPVGLDDGGGVFVPEDVRTLGWYTASVPVAADQGSAVIVGHRDSAVQGAGAFSGIENLAAGEVIEVATGDGTMETYTVDEVRLVAKSDFASIANEAFAMNGEHRLTLITCGGAFDSAAGSYLSNVFVIATPSTT